MLAFLRRLVHREDQMSKTWRIQHAQTVDQFEGIAWRWPVNKLRNEAASFNRAVLRREVERVKASA